MPTPCPLRGAYPVDGINQSPGQQRLVEIVVHIKGGVIEHELHHLQQVVAEDVRIPLTDGGELDVIDRLRRLPAGFQRGNQPFALLRGHLARSPPGRFGRCLLLRILLGGGLGTALDADADPGYGLQIGEEVTIEIEPGRSLIVSFLTMSDVHEDGTRTVFFELNGQPRSVRVADHSVEGDLHTHPKAEPDNPQHVAAPMPGVVTTCRVQPGQRVAHGDVLLSIEAMKMENVLLAERDGKVAKVLAGVGDTLAVDQPILEFE